ncbi:MAG: DUF111 family protein [Candidatus Aminicenantes bacterium]|nr:DUF111 family protein [Candidatus Aminicenantes bacterium]
MKLLIDPIGGIAGDMFAAALISAGANPELMKTAMLSAASKLGTADLSIKKTSDGCMQLKMKLRSSKHHLEENEAKAYLNELFNEFNIEKKYRYFGEKILTVLLKAEKKAHSDYNIIITHPTGNHHHSKNHAHHHLSDQHKNGTCLHEAQDIIIDIMGTVMGMQNLKIEPKAILLNPVSVGDGTIDFSHGIFDVPAPATKIILEQFGITWVKGPVAKELCTPTGASILAALGATLDPSKRKLKTRFISKGKARGTYLYNIQAFQIYIY